MDNSTEFINKVSETLINPAIILIFAVALIMFLWGVLQFVRGADNEEARTTGGRHILWGLVGMAIMLSAFGILRFISTTLQLDNTTIDTIEK